MIICEIMETSGGWVSNENERNAMKDFTKDLDRLYLLIYLTFVYRAQFQALS